MLQFLIIGNLCLGYKVKEFLLVYHNSELHAVCFETAVNVAGVKMQSTPQFTFTCSLTIL